MIRFAIVLLLLANAGYYAFSQGMLRSLGWAPENPSEPNRVQEQVKPNDLRILTPQEAAQAQPVPKPAMPEPAAETVADAVHAPESEHAADKPTDKAAEKLAEKTDKSEKADKVVGKECLVAGTFEGKQVDALRFQLAKLPEGSWKLDSTTTTGRWMVYVGKFSSQDALDKRRDELRALDISTDRARTASLEPGISLGRFSTEEAASRHLAAMGKKGVAGAKVVVDRPESTTYSVRISKIDAATKKRVQTWYVMEGKDLQSCS